MSTCKSTAGTQELLELSRLDNTSHLLCTNRQQKPINPKINI